MADDISKKITIDVEIADDGQQQLKQYKAAFDNLRNSINGLSSPLTALSGSLAGLGGDISKLNDSVGKLGDQTKSLAGSGNKLKDSVDRLKGSYDALKNVLDFVRGSVASLEDVLTGGLALIITFGPEILKWVSALFKSKDAIDKTKLSFENLNQAFQSADYSNAIKQFNQMKTYVELANKSILNKKDVLQQYNETLGTTIGKAARFNEIESKINILAPAYIKMTLLKAQANAALEQAVKKAQDAEAAKHQSDADVLSFWDHALISLKHNLKIAWTEQQAVKEQADWADDLHKKAEQRRRENADDLQKQSRTELDLFKEATQKAEAIAKQAGFNLFTGEILSKGKAANTPGNEDLKQTLQTRANAVAETSKIVEESLKKQIQTTYEAYGSEAAQINAHYQEQLSKLKGYLDKKLITQEKYTNAKRKFDAEQQSDLAALMNKYNEQDKDRLEQAQNELTELQIKGMHEGHDKEIAELEQERSEKLQQLEKLNVESATRMAKLTAEMRAAKTKDPKADVSELQKQLDAEYDIMAINCKREEAIAKQTAEAIAKIKAGEAETKLEEKDQKNIDKTQTPEAKLEAEKKLILDKYQFEVTQAQGDAEKIERIEEEKNKKIADLTNKYTKEKTEKAKKAAEELNKFELHEAKKMEEEAFSFISQSIKQASEAKIAGLEQDKEAALGNSSLTSAQKLAIEQRYKQQEAQIKIKAFREEQEASIAQAVINGALAITKSSAQEGVLAPLYIPMVIAETAIQIAKIAGQKPPAYAAGGLHYNSDGRGGLLPGYSKTDNTNAWLRSGEGIVVSEAMQVPWARNLVSAINVGFGGRDFSMANPGRGYAVGGIFTDGGDANRYYNQPVHDQKNLANSIAYQMINNFPPVYVDVKDINNQQNILAQTINRVNL